MPKVLCDMQQIPLAMDLKVVFDHISLLFYDEGQTNLPQCGCQSPKLSTALSTSLSIYIYMCSKDKF